MPIEEQFVCLDEPQVISAKKNLLYVEMELLTSLQKYESYKKLRKEEMAVKNLLKKIIVDVQKEMELLLQYMPQIKLGSSITTVVNKSNQKRDILEEEIQNLRKKISMITH